MDNLSLRQMTSFLGECDCTPRGNVEPAKRPASESENEFVPVAPPTKRPKAAHTPPPVWSERFASSKSTTTNSSSAGSSRSSTPSTPKHVVQDKTPTPAIRSHQVPTPTRPKYLATQITSRPVSSASDPAAMIPRPRHTYFQTTTLTQSTQPAQTPRPPRPTRLPSTISSPVATESPQSPASTQSTQSPRHPTTPHLPRLPMTAHLPRPPMPAHLPRPPMPAHLPRPPATAHLPRPPRLPHSTVPARDVVPPPPPSANSKHGAPLPRPTHSPRPPVTIQTPHPLAPPAQPPQSPDLAMAAQLPISHLQKAEKARQPLKTFESVDSRAPAVEPVKEPQPRPVSKSRWGVKTPAATTALPIATIATASTTTAPATATMTQQQQQPSQPPKHLPSLQYLPGLCTPLPQPSPTLQSLLLPATAVNSNAPSSYVHNNALSPSVGSATPDDVSMSSLMTSSYHLELMMSVAYELARIDNSFPEELDAGLAQAMEKVLEIAKHLGPDSST
ncbi:hypothetical protein GGH92_001955 [Coemansia sp. RSA 2673]|nr:hypothetical protein GGH92_001955 [Coemansia sp. RSA 2673]